MNRRFFIALAFSALFGLLAILIFKTILEKALQAEKGKQPNQIVMAVAKIPFGTAITRDQVKLEPYSMSAPEGTFSNVGDVIGKFAQTEIDANVPVQAKHIATSDYIGPRTKVRKDYRAMAIRVDEASSVAGFATPGSTVDVVAVITPGTNAKPVSKVIVQDLRVLANGQQTQARTDGQGRIGNTVTLEVTPAQAEMLTLAGREGTLHLLLRHPADRDVLPVPPVVMPQMVDSYPDDTRPAPTVSPSTKVSLPTFTPTPTPTPSPTPKVVAVQVMSGGKVDNIPVRQ